MLAVILPPKHVCPACGKKHHTLAESQQIVAHFARCAHCKQPFGYDYLVTDEVWAATGLSFHDGVLHLSCVEELIGRRLGMDDFVTTYPLGNRCCANDHLLWAYRRGIEAQQAIRGSQ